MVNLAKEMKYIADGVNEEKRAGQVTEAIRDAIRLAAKRGEYSITLCLSAGQMDILAEMGFTVTCCEVEDVYDALSYIYKAVYKCNVSWK